MYRVVHIVLLIVVSKSRSYPINANGTSKFAANCLLFGPKPAKGCYEKGSIDIWRFHSAPCSLVRRLLADEVCKSLSLHPSSVLVAGNLSRLT